jgi:hypothetical protein
MSLFANARRRGFGVASVAAALCLCVAPLGEPTAAAAAGIFAVMDGNWQGDGSIKWYSGESEPIRCKSTNNVASDGYQLKQTLTCANPSLGEPWKINTDISYREAAGVIIGTWNESRYGLSGQITGRANQTKIDARVRTVTNNNIAVHVQVTTSGTQQMVNLEVTTPEGLTQISVNLKKG